MANSPREGDGSLGVRGLDPLGIINRVLAGRYRILECIGRGGMGVVYLAHQEALDRDVVIKVVRVDADEDSLGRFQREARSLSRLSHPNIVQVIDHGRDSATGLLFIVMEYIRGITLTRYMKQRGSRLMVSEFRPIAEQILNGVADAHRLSLIHRDLKPSNVMLTSADGETLLVKLLDFGLSKVSGVDDPLTQVNQMIGSAMYMAPEQLRGKIADTRADVYALGVLFYQMLTNAKPFDADDPYQVFSQQVQGKFVPLVDKLPPNHDVPRALIDLVERCMSVDPNQRPVDARALSNELSEVLSATPSLARHAILVASGMQDADSQASGPRSSVSLSVLRNTRSFEGQVQSISSPAARLGLLAGTALGMLGISMLMAIALLLFVLLIRDTEMAKTDPTVAAIEASPSAVAAEALRTRALQAMSEGDYDRSVALLAEAVTMSPQEGDLRELLGIAMGLRDNRLQNAEPEVPVAPAVPAAPVPVAAIAPKAPKGISAPVQAARPSPGRVSRPAPAAIDMGSAVLTSTPAGLSYRIAGLAEGKTPSRVDLPVGTWPIVMLRGSEQIYEGTITIVPAGVAFVSVDAPQSPPTPAPAPLPVPAAVLPVPVAVLPVPVAIPPVLPPEPVAQPEIKPSIVMGRIEIQSPNLYGEILINGKSYGFAPIRATLPVGVARVELKVGKTVRKTLEIEVAPGEAVVVLR